MRPGQPLVTFTDDDTATWTVINDTVMGGVSRSRMRRSENNTGIFEGTVSLEHNGGFASVRTMLGRRDLSDAAGLELRVRGDGRTYQIRLRTDDRFDGIAYRAPLETRDGTWVLRRIPFESFMPSFRGRILTDVPPLDTSRIQQLGFMLADQHPGPFALEIDYVRPW